MTSNFYIKKKFIKGFDRRRDTNYFSAAWEMYLDLFLSDEVSASLTNLPFFEFPGKKRTDSYAFLRSLSLDSSQNYGEHKCCPSGAGSVSELEVNVWIYCSETERSHTRPSHLKELLCLCVVLCLTAPLGVLPYFSTPTGDSMWSFRDHGGCNEINADVEWRPVRQLCAVQRWCLHPGIMKAFKCLHKLKGREGKALNLLCYFEGGFFFLSKDVC